MENETIDAKMKKWKRRYWFRSVLLPIALTTSLFTGVKFHKELANNQIYELLYKNIGTARAFDFVHEIPGRNIYVDTQDGVILRPLDEIIQDYQNLRESDLFYRMGSENFNSQYVDFLNDEKLPSFISTYNKIRNIYERLIFVGIPAGLTGLLSSLFPLISLCNYMEDKKCKLSKLEK